MISYIEALFTSPHHEVALMYTDLTNSFDILSSFNITLHNPISLSSLFPPRKDILLLLCHDLSPAELQTGKP